jgi:hypothetical protein
MYVIPHSLVEIQGQAEKYAVFIFRVGKYNTQKLTPFNSLIKLPSNTTVFIA